MNNEKQKPKKYVLSKKEEEQDLGMNSVEAEECLLGAILVNPQKIKSILVMLSGEDFSEKKYGTIFDVCSEFSQKGNDFDDVVLKAELESRKLFPPNSLDQLFSHFLNKLPNSDSALSYARVIAKNSYLRKLRAYNNSVNELIRQGEQDKIEDIEKPKRPLLEDSILPSFSDEASFFQEIEESAQDGFETGIRCIDSNFGDTKRGNLNIVCARPGSGKTLFALQTSINIAKKHKVLFLSYEMTKTELRQKMFSHIFQFNSKFFRTITSEGMKEISKGFDNWKKLKMLTQNIFFAKPEDTNIRSVVAEITSAVKLYNIDYVFIDYIQMLEAGKDVRTYDIEKVVQSLKNTAQTLNIGITTLAQLRRDSDKEIPTLSSLADSTSLERNADSIFALQGEIQKTNEEIDRNIMNFYCLKGRWSSSGSARFFCDLSTGTFRDFMPHEVASIVSRKTDDKRTYSL